MEYSTPYGRGIKGVLHDRGLGSDVLVLAHGYFNHMVGKRLKAGGWRLVDNQGFKYWSQRRYERR